MNKQIKSNSFIEMKDLGRVLNKYNWPYFSISLLDESIKPINRLILFASVVVFLLADSIIAFIGFVVMSVIIISTISNFGKNADARRKGFLKTKSDKNREAVDQEREKIVGLVKWRKLQLERLERIVEENRNTDEELSREIEQAYSDGYEFSLVSSFTVLDGIKMSELAFKICSPPNLDKNTKIMIKLVQLQSRYAEKKEQVQILTGIISILLHNGGTVELTSDADCFEKTMHLFGCSSTIYTPLEAFSYFGNVYPIDFSMSLVAHKILEVNTASSYRFQRAIARWLKAEKNTEHYEYFFNFEEKKEISSPLMLIDEENNNRLHRAHAIALTKLNPKDPAFLDLYAAGIDFVDEELKSGINNKFLLSIKEQLSEIEKLYSNPTTVLKVQHSFNPTRLTMIRPAYFEFSRSMSEFSEIEKNILSIYITYTWIISKVHDKDFESLVSGNLKGVIINNGLGSMKQLSDFQPAHKIENGGDLRWFQQDRAEFEAQIQEHLKRAPTSKSEIQEIFQTLENMKSASSGSVAEQYVKNKMDGSDRWGNDAYDENSIFTKKTEASLSIGKMENGDDLQYSGDGSLITIASPGAGKTQCHVLPNLKSYKGPMIVLDIKGECWENTSDWRKENIGPVHRFSPFDGMGSAKFNPLTFIRKDEEHLWEDSKFLADLLVVPGSNTDSSWEKRGKDLLSCAIAVTVMFADDSDRNMSSVLDLMSPSDEMWEDFIATLKGNDEYPTPSPMRRAGSVFGSMPDGQLAGIRDGALQHLSMWEGSRVEKSTLSTDWSPRELREQLGTLYICVPPGKTKEYASLLRVILAMHLRIFMEVLPKDDCLPVQFILDEMPQLGRMPPIEEALEVGRQYGIRLWMFAQNLGQLREAYPNADGLLNNCAVQIFMNPKDDTAELISKRLGTKKGIFETAERPVATVSELIGPEYKNFQIIFGVSEKPIKAQKVFDWETNTPTAINTEV